MSKIFKDENSSVKTSLINEDQYKVYNKNNERVAKIEFNPNGLTENHLVAILKDRFKERTNINKHINECLDSINKALQLNIIRRVENIMTTLGYCELQVDLNSGINLIKAIGDEEITSKLIPINKLHATIMYDESNPEIVPSPSRAVYKTKIIGIKQLGKIGSKWRACALELESPAIKERHGKLVEEGFKHSYDDLLLHVSLVYGPESEVIFPLLKKLFEEGKLPETITLCNETWESLKD